MTVQQETSDKQKPTKATSTKLININTATAKELQKLSGIGPKMAQRIIDYRIESDGFKRLEDLKKVERTVKRHFELGGHKAYYLLKALKNHQIILVSSLPD